MDLFDGLKEKQKIALQAMLDGENIFLSGNAGTGKSFVLNRYLDHVRETSDKNIIICSTTGISATLIGGTTVHRAFKLPAGDVSFYIQDPTEYKTPKEISHADIIVIDEISMCTYEVFRAMASMIIYAKNKSHMTKQLIVTGDFFQLPPVLNKRKNKQGVSEFDIFTEHLRNYGDGWCFNTEEWKVLGLKNYNLDEVVRQNDKEFVKNLTLARYGDPSCLPYFNQRVNYNGNFNEKALFLFGTNKSADDLNQQRLDELDGELVTYDAISEGEVKKSDKPTEDELHLKVGARVMLIANDTKDRYQNGSLGTVTSLNDDCIGVKLDNGKEVDIEEVTWKVNAPRTQIEVVDGAKVTTVITETIGKFTQFPLKLAWGITMHKSQGQTFDHVVVDPVAFAEGQLYVALSRVTHIKGLELTRPIRPQFLKCSQSVIKFTESINKNQYGDIRTQSIEVPEYLVPEIEEFIRSKLSCNI